MTLLSSKFPDWGLRLLTSLVMLPSIVLFMIWAKDPWFLIALGFLFVWCVSEWKLFSPEFSRITPVFCVGVLYIAGGFLGWYVTGKSYPYQLLFYLALIWSCDTGAYCFGKMLGGPKLIPFVSPNKTWSGLIGGIVFPFLLAPSLHLWIFNATLEGPFLIHIGFIIIFSHLGDLFESWVKRRFNKKDSGIGLPGHGGILDRLDSVLMVGWLLLICHYIGINF